MRRIILGAGVLALQATGCGAELSTSGSMVHLATGLPSPYCRELGVVYGSAGGGMYTSSEYKMRSAQIRLRNHAAELGGNLVVTDVVGADVAGFTLSGHAYACAAPPVGGQAGVGNAPPVQAVPGSVATPAPVAAVPSPSVEERLIKLQELLGKGLITQEEHDRRRQEILKSL